MNSKNYEFNLHAEEMANFFKGLASPLRLLILIQLSEGEKSVSDLIHATGIAQTSMSQHLNKLKEEGIVETRRDHRVVYYSIIIPKVMQVIAQVYDLTQEKDRQHDISDIPASGSGMASARSSNSD